MNTHWNNIAQSLRNQNNILLANCIAHTGTWIQLQAYQSMGNSVFGLFQQISLYLEDAERNSIKNTSWQNIFNDINRSNRILLSTCHSRTYSSLDMMIMSSRHLAALNPSMGLEVMDSIGYFIEINSLIKDNL